MRTLQDWVDLLADTSGKLGRQAANELESALSSSNETVRSRAVHYLLKRFTDEAWSARPLALSLLQRAWIAPGSDDAKKAIEVIFPYAARLPPTNPEFASAVRALTAICRQRPDSLVHLGGPAVREDLPRWRVSLLVGSGLVVSGPTVLPSLLSLLEKEAGSEWTAPLLEAVAPHALSEPSLLAPAVFAAFQKSREHSRWLSAALLHTALQALATRSEEYPGGLEDLEGEALNAISGSSLGLRYQAVALLGLARPGSSTGAAALQRALADEAPSVAAVAAAGLLRRNVSIDAAREALSRLAQGGGPEGVREVLVAVGSLPSAPFSLVRPLIEQIARAGGDEGEDAAALLEAHRQPPAPRR